MARSQLVKIDNYSKIMARLTAQDRDPYMVERIYPVLAKNAEREITPQGLTFLIAQAIYDATMDMDHLYQKLLNLQFERFIDALITDESARTQAKAFYRAARLEQAAAQRSQATSS